jgi:hypothetical protein
MPNQPKKDESSEHCKLQKIIKRKAVKKLDIKKGENISQSGQESLR